MALTTSTRKRSPSHLLTSPGKRAHTVGAQPGSIREHLVVVDAVRNLLTHGVAVVPFYNLSGLQIGITNMRDTLDAMPEFLPDPTGAEEYVQGAFGALGNPGSTHNEFVRELRGELMAYALPVWRAYAEVSGHTHLQQLIDRMAVRRVGTVVKPVSDDKSVHRDINAYAAGQTFGGWVNLSYTDQYFTCHKGNLPDSPATRGGFVSCKQVPASDLTTLVVPPGHWVVFRSDLAHTVHTHKVSCTEYRCYFGWYLSKTAHNLQDVTFRVAHAKQQVVPESLEAYFRDQGTAPTPSGQPWPMHSAMHASALLYKPSGPIAWTARRMQLSVINWFPKRKGGPKAPPKYQSYQCIGRYLPSLQALGLPRYPSYSEAEKACYYPIKL